MSTFSEAAKNEMLGALDPSEVRLHDGDPGDQGDDNRVGGSNGVEDASFSSAAGGERTLSSQVDFTGLDGGQTVTWFSVWDSSGVFLGKGEITSGDTAANAAGAYSLTTATALRLLDPAGQG